MSSTTNKSALLDEWKKAYNQSVIEHLRPHGSVLEIGFGNGYGSELISKSNPKTHIIIESNPQLYEKAIHWAVSHPSVKVLQGPWQPILPTLGKFDAIYFHDYPQAEQDILLYNFLYPEDFQRSFYEAKILIDQLENEICMVKVKFSNKEIEDFILRALPIYADKLPKFFKILKENGNISEIQYESYINQFEKSQKKDIDEDLMLVCLEACLKNHLNQGGRFSPFLNFPTSRYDDSEFFDRIISRTDVEYKEKQIVIKTSDKSREAIIIIVEKLS